jgi:hypothetical protein
MESSMAKYMTRLIFAGAFLAVTVFASRMVLAADAAVPPAAAAAVDDDGLTFFDSVAFDEDLSHTLAKQPNTALVVPSGPFSPNQLPTRLEKWLSVIAKSGGSVKLKKVSADPPSRGFLSDMVELSVKSHQDAELSAMYAAVKSYDAIVTFNGNDVTGVQFIKRPAPAK